jgi:resuscitation-promoting factor RpfB
MSAAKWDAALVAAALVTVGVAGGCVLTTVAGPEPSPAITKTATVRVTLPPKTLPPTTVTITRTVERASRSGRISTPERLAGMNIKGSRPLYLAYARARVPADQWPCLRKLWQRESGWNPKADNPRSSAYGIPQMLRMKPGTPWRTQITRGLGYIDHRYGTPCAAWAHFGRKGWY